MSTALRTKLLIGVALAIAGYVAFSSPDSQPAEPAKSGAVEPHSRSQRPAETRGEHAVQTMVLLAHRVTDGPSAGALFAPHSWYTPPPPPPPAPAPTLSVAQLAAMRTPQAPPLPFTYLGSYVQDGSSPVFFLTQGDRVYNVRVGDTLDNIYSVDSFTNGQLLMTYKPLKLQQQLSVGGSK